MLARIIGSHTIQSPLALARLKPVEPAKDLGVILDSYLTYDHHISKTVSSCCSKLYQINRVKESFDKETLKLLITSLVFSKMLYCSTVWSSQSGYSQSRILQAKS